MSAPIVLSLCDATGHMVEPWADNGYHCLCYDLQHSIRADRVVERGTRGGSITYRWGDVRSLTVEDIGRPVILFAFPPCTHLSVSGARDFRRKGLRLLIDALEIVEACRVLAMNSGSPWMLEQPVSRLATLWRAPDHYFNPFDFTALEPRDNYTKKTSLWTGGGFVMPPPQRDLSLGEADKTRIHHASPSADRGDIRSETPRGFAEAVWAANDPIMRRLALLATPGAA